MPDARERLSVVTLVPGQQTRGCTLRTVADQEAELVGHRWIAPEGPGCVRAVDPGRLDERAPEILYDVALCHRTPVWHGPVETRNGDRNTQRGRHRPGDSRQRFELPRCSSVR